MPFCIDVKNVERIKWIDIAKGIAIILVIVGHTVSTGIVRRIIFSFHMPLFFMIAGITIKKEFPKKESYYIRKDFMRLYLPVFLMYLIAIIREGIRKKSIIAIRETCIDAFYRIIWGNGIDYRWDTPLGIWNAKLVGVLWFLIALFWARVVYRKIAKLDLKHRMLIIVPLLCMELFYGVGKCLPQSIDLLPMIIFFMECGRYVREYVEFDSQTWKIIVFTALVFWVCFTLIDGISIEMATRAYSWKLYCVANAICGSLLVMTISIWIEKIKYINDILSFCGRHSLEILCIHHLDWSVTSWWRVEYNISGLHKYAEILNPINRVTFNLICLIFFLLVKRGAHAVWCSLKQKQLQGNEK